MSTILALNLGSATLKAAWFTAVAAPGSSEPVLTEVHRFTPSFEPASSTAIDFAALLEQLTKDSARTIAPDFIVHRIVHGGQQAGPAVLNADLGRQLRALAAWAPLHQPAALALADAAAAHWPKALGLAVFDTSWHRSLAPLMRALPLSPTMRARGLQRYGFHGLAFQSAYRQLCAQAPETTDRRVVLAHLGGGSSLCAVRDGHSIDTTMSLTPLGGLPMATRSGDLDPGVVLALQRGGMTADEIERELSGHSGLLGLSGLSGDLRTLLASAEASAQLAVAHYTLRVAQGVAAMAVSLGGLDDLVFSGGIGTHAATVRASILERLGWLGARLDHEANRADAQRIERDDSACRIWVGRVDEERELAFATMPWLAQRQPEHGHGAVADDHAA